MALPIAPSQTIYIQNLNDTIPVNEMKRELYCLFSSVAPVVEIAARKGIKARGQAWVSFASIEVATIAMQRFQGFNFLGKEMHIEFARSITKVLTEQYENLVHRNEEVEEEEPEPIVESPVLNVTGYPPKANAIVLGILFRKEQGYQKLEMQTDFTLVYFDTAEHANIAMEKMQNFSVTEGFRLKITHA